MAPISLAQLDAVSLLNRIDTKFLLTASRLAGLLAGLADAYVVLEVDGRRQHQYRTLYFDTPEYDLYHRHRSSEPIRHKVRSRAYVDSGLTFFEIKSKTQDHRTVKHRFATPDFVGDWTPAASAFVRHHLGPDAPALQPTLSNDFLRVTLMDRRRTERLTLDLNVQFDCDGRTAVLPGLAIAELKQGHADQPSPFADAMRAAGILPTSISKYCVGVGLLVADADREIAAGMLTAIERVARGERRVSRAAPPTGAAHRAR